MKPPTPLGFAADGRDTARRLERAEQRLGAALKRLQQKEQQLQAERRGLSRFRELGRQLEAQLASVTQVFRPSASAPFAVLSHSLFPESQAFAVLRHWGCR